MTKNDETLKEIMEKAFAAQQAHIQRHPERFKRYLSEQKADEKKEQEKMLLFPYRRRDIPDQISQTIIKGVNENGEKLVVTHNERAVLQAFKDKRILVLMLGPVGTGKTIAGCRWLVNQDGGLYVKSREFCSYSEKMTVDRPFIQLYYRIPHLFLEELATEEDKDIGKIRELLQQRFDNNLKTLVSINESPGEAEELLGKRVSRRLFALGKQIAFSKILCPGENRRKELRNE